MSKKRKPGKGGERREQGNDRRQKEKRKEGKEGGAWDGRWKRF